MSNTLERSIKTPSVYSPFSKEHVISLVSWSMAWSVESLFWKPNYFSFRMPLESKWLYTLFYIILSKTFENTGMIDMGQ